ncbi:YggN family protein [Salinimicrobium sediminilitoris]|uniref:hypothetical protein n=1 Tax=Salinimicrobium sediminilitoris TaxID=2876715 RepID=UPI001E433229|nr:hypothetical protein [Salinimicrobium sediminilitoris]MCC8358485.1 hypothetical protein [Salinimicrobium sediminilitoris]
MKTTGLKTAIIALLCAAPMLAQTSKLDKTFKTNKDVTVNIDARHTLVNVEYWDKNEVRVSAHLEGGEGNNTKALQSWMLDVDGSASEVKINSAAAPGGPGDFNMAALQAPLAKLPEMIAPLTNMIGPMLEGMANHPLPPEFYASMGEINFDYEQYQKDGEKYMEQFEKKIEKNFGKDFEKAMEDWAQNFERDSALRKKQEMKMEAWSKDFEKKMEAWGESFGKDMEKWGEEFGKEMETWAASVEKQAKEQKGNSKSNVIILKDGNSEKKVLEVRMPRNGQLKLNVRHGEVQLGGTTNNLRGEVSHSKFSAGEIAGRNTNFKLAYTPVMIKNWKYGVLNAAYVQDLRIEKAESLKLESNSSNVHLKELGETGILAGTFGELRIDKVSPRFKNLDITLENSDLVLDLPESSFNFTYNGTNSEVEYPKGLKLTSSKSYDNQKLKGYNGSQNAGASINIQVRFSDVVLK